MKKVIYEILIGKFYGDKDGLNKTSEEIAEIMEGFVKWIISSEIFYGGLTERYFSASDGRIPAFKNIDEAFEYWHNEIYTKNE